MTAPGWYNAEGDPPGTQRYWDGETWVGEPTPVAPAAGGASPQQSWSDSGAAPGPRLGTPGARMGARIIDFIIMIVFAVILTAVGLLGSSDDLVIESGDGSFNFSYDQTLGTPVSYLIWGLLGWGWAFAWTHLKGGSPGKLMLGMKVSDAATGASPIGVQQALIRTGTHGLALIGVLSTDLGDFSGFALLIIGLISLIMLFSDDHHRTVMDRIAKTLVTK